MAGLCGTGAFTPQTLTAYLHDHIPLTAAMGLMAAEVNWDAVRLRVPITPNLNHNRTAFGGSLSSALVMAGWSFVHNRLRTSGYYAQRPGTQLVVSRSETRYLKPVVEDFDVVCGDADPAAWDHFTECLRRKHRAKFRLKAVALADGQTAATLTAAFVAISDA